MLVELDRVLEDTIINSSKHGNWLLKNLHIRFFRGDPMRMFAQAFGNSGLFTDFGFGGGNPGGTEVNIFISSILSSRFDFCSILEPYMGKGGPYFLKNARGYKGKVQNL